VALELLDRDSTYAWDLVPGSAGFDRRVLFSDLEGQAPPARDLRQRVQATLSEVQPAAVLIPGWSEPHALAALEWCVRCRVPAVVMSETTAWDEPRKAWKEWGKRLCVRLFSAGFVGGHPHQDYLATLGLPRERTALGYDAVDNQYFAARAEEIGKQKAESRNRYGLPEHYFLASARFVEKKNLIRLLEAYARYRTCGEKPEPRARSSESARPWDLVLLGDGPLRGELELRVADLALQTAIHLPGFKQYPDLPAYYALAGAFVHASTTEPWGLVVNEAMASGLPVLVSNRCGCARDLVEEARNGFTFDPLNVEEMANRMAQVAATNCDRKAMGCRSREIIALWGPEAFAKGLSQAVNTALAVPVPKPSLLDRVLLQVLLRR
jgi:glycosyltransferase involved in cell wall biosynthesis